MNRNAHVIAVILCFSIGSFMGATVWNQGRVITDRKHDDPLQNASSAGNDASIQSRVRRLLDESKNGKPAGLKMATLSQDIDSWLRLDPVECINALHAAEGSGLLDASSLATIAEAMMNGGISQALHDIRSINDKRVQLQLLSLILYKQMAENPREAIEVLEAIPRPSRYRYALQLAQSWVAKEPVEAVETFFNDPRLPFEAAQVALSTWMKADLQSAFQYTLNASNDQLRGRKDEVLLWLASVSADNRPEEAHSFVSALPDSPIKDQMLKRIFGGFFAKSPERARQVIEESTPGALAPWMALNDRIIQTAMVDRAGARRLADMFPVGQERRRAYRNVASLSTAVNPKDAAQWAAGITDPLTRSLANNEVARVWFGRSPLDSLSYALGDPNENSSGGLADLLLNRLEGKLSGADPSSDESWKWVNKLPDAAKAHLRARITASDEGNALRKLAPVLR